MKETDITLVFKHIYNVVRRHGITKVVERLRQLEQSGITQHQLDIVDQIIIEVTKLYGITRTELFEHKKGTVAEARKMCYVVMKETLPLNETQIGVQFGRTNRVVYRAIDEYRNMSMSQKFDANWLKKKQIVDTAIKRYIQDLTA